MFTKEDITNYLNQVEALEQQMEKIYFYLYNQVENPEYKNIFLELSQDERRHDGRVTEILDYFKK